MSSSFFQRARERAHEAAQQISEKTQSMASGASANAAGNQNASSGNATATGSSGMGSGFTYTGSLPHLLRQSVAQYNPRHDSSRHTYLLTTALKSVSIDHEATARETKRAAVATYRWGQDTSADNRNDGVGDEAVTDVADRLAYTLQLLGELESEHVKRIEDARAILKRVRKAEEDLASRRDRRAKVRKELAALMPERAKGGSERITSLEEQLKNFESDDREAEEELGRLRRECLRDGFEAHFDSVLQLGEKMAIVARHGKLLTHQLPVYKPPFPAPKGVRKPDEPSWPGAEKTALVRATLSRAIETYQPSTQLPELPESLDNGAPASSSASSVLGRADTASFGVSHKHELDHSRAQAAEQESAGAGAEVPAATQGAAPGSTSPSLPARLNHEPTVLPATTTLPPPAGSPGAGGRTKHRVPPLPAGPSGPSPSGAATATTMPSPPTHETDLKGELAEGPTMAETGAPILGPGGPSSGQLKPRKPSVAASAGTGTSTAGATTTASAAGSASTAAATAAPHGASDDARVRKEAEAAREQDEVRRHSINARLRRDRTVVRRGEPGWEQAEEEGLPPYEE